MENPDVEPKQPSAGVLLPERKTRENYHYLDSISRDAAANIYNSVLDEVARLNPARAQLAAPLRAPELGQYDAGLLNDFGGGNVEWWQDYLRAELDRAHDFYQSQLSAPTPAPTVEPAHSDDVIVPRELRPVLSMILNALDRDAEDGKQVRGEMAEQLRALLNGDQK